MALCIAAWTAAACGGGSIPNVDVSCPPAQAGCETAVDTDPASGTPATPAKASPESVSGADEDKAAS